MNKKILITCLVGFITLFAGDIRAQVAVNFNVGSQPLWGPVGYDRANYYYLPDIDTYYSVPTRQYVSLQNDRWVYSNSLPSRYSGYNLYNGYKVVMNGTKPYRYHSDHKVKYAKYKGNKGKQPTIRYSTNPKYFVVKGHPKHAVRRSGTIKPKGSLSSKVRMNAGSGTGGSGKAKSNGKGGGKEHGKGKH